MSHETDATVRPAQGQATALLVIDVQQGLFRKSTPIYRAEPLLNTITTLIGRAHAASVLVVYIQHASDKVLPFGSAAWQIHPRLHPGEGDLIVHKQQGNAFEDTSLHTELAGRVVGRVIVTGLVTQREASFRMAASRRRVSAQWSWATRWYWQRTATRAERAASFRTARTPRSSSRSGTAG